MILVVGLQNEFGPDAKHVSPFIEMVLAHERPNHEILHTVNNDLPIEPVIPTYQDQIIHSERQLQLLTFSKEFIYIMGIHYGRCLRGWENVMSCPVRTVINCTMIHEDDTWADVIVKRNFYLWSYKGFCKI